MRDAKDSDDGHPVVQQLLDALDSATCVVDADGVGVIVAVNRAWLQYASLNGGASSACGIGVSYLDVCERTSATLGLVDPSSAEAVQADLCATEATQVVTGLRSVLDGSADSYSREFSCPSPTADH